MSQGINPRDLAKDRLTTTDAEGRRLHVYAQSVTGFYRNRRSLVQAVLVLVFLALPWWKINGQQAILLDVIHRRFTLFGIQFWAHDAPMLAFVAGAAVLSIAFITALFGRVWCGWACPQTVFIDGIFLRIERLIEGDAVKRRAFDARPLDIDKALLKAAKWSLFTLVALVISHSFLGYFVGVERLAEIVRRPPAENIGLFAVMAGITGLLLFDFGWFREQFCTVVCPYGRFQSLLLDSHSLVIAYDAKRPDCVDCFRCVQVCPTGIDIRRGVQLECIACTACIDACDDVMTRLRLPPRLIKYASEESIQGRKTKFLRARTVVYFGLLVMIVTALTAVVGSRRDLELFVARAAGAPYQEIAAAGTDGAGTKIVNRFRSEVTNRTFRPVVVTFTQGQEVVAGANIVLATQKLELAAGETRTVDLFVEFPKAELSEGKRKFQLTVTSDSELTKNTEEVMLVGPYR
ncbi:MAG TPA: cytochrome c oxidase accessory protein CcoG [Oligoflexia bacterium]|nr:cytochrome c oxidase accessory protein CcoG [Oligoflexia bacterium]